MIFIEKWVDKRVLFKTSIFIQIILYSKTSLSNESASEWNTKVTENSRKGSFYNGEFIISKTNFGMNNSKLQKKKDQTFFDEYNERVENTSSKDNKRLFPISGMQISTTDNEKPNAKLTKMLNQSTKTSSITNDGKLESNLMSNYIGIGNTGDEDVLQNQKNKITQNDHKQGYIGENFHSKNKKEGSTIKPDKTSMSNKTGMLENQETGNLKPFVEELYFLNKSEIIFDEDDFGLPLEDSDIEFLPEEEKEYLVKRQKMKEEGKDNMHHQRLLSIFEMGSTKKGQTNRAATTNASKKWGNCQVPYTIGNNYSPEQRGVIKGAMNQFAKETGINWVPKNAGNKDFVHIQRGRGCSSHVGKSGGQQTMNLGKFSIKIHAITKEIKIYYYFIMNF